MLFGAYRSLSKPIEAYRSLSKPIEGMCDHHGKAIEAFDNSFAFGVAPMGYPPGLPMNSGFRVYTQAPSKDPTTLQQVLRRGEAERGIQLLGPSKALHSAVGGFKV